MPVGTQATVKGVPVDALHQLNTQVILGNVYHLNLRPTSERIHALVAASVYELAKAYFNRFRWLSSVFISNQRTIEPDGVTFKSHLDGSKHRLTPKRGIDIQRNLGSDIMMPPTFVRRIQHPETSGRRYGHYPSMGKGSV